MKEKYLINVHTGAEADEIQKIVTDKYKWNEIGIISYSLPLLNSLTVCENIMLPLTFSENLSIKKAEIAVKELLEKFGALDIIYKRPQKLNEYDLLIVKFLRAIIRKPEQILFVLPHNIIKSGDYHDFVTFADALENDCITIIENINYSEEYIKTEFLEINFNKWQTCVLDTLK